MFKTLVLQRMYHLSDEQVEYQIIDRTSFRDFLGLSSGDKVPDARTIWSFREQLTKQNLFDKLFDDFYKFLEAKQLIMNEGVIIDGSFVEVPRQHNSREENKKIKNGEGGTLWNGDDEKNKKQHKDTDARWTKKNVEKHYGYKNHAKIDARSKLIKKGVTTDASVHDSKPTRELVDKTDEEQPLFADSAYIGKGVKGLGYSAEAEVKTWSNFTKFNRLKVSAGLGYSFWGSRFKVSADFDYILKNRETYMENRYRVSGGLTYSEKIRSFKLSLRAKYQASFYDESHAYHKYNPKTYIRSRFEITYSFFSKPLKLYASTEMFIRLYKKDARFIDEMRSVVGVTYRLNKNNSLDFYLRADNEVQVKNPAYIYYIGVGYSFK